MPVESVRARRARPRGRQTPAETAHAIPFNVMSFHAGGAGARPGKDGLSATAFPSGVRNMPIEVNEALSPIVVWKKEYRQDSGGAGEFRGGLGQVMEVGSVDTAPWATERLLRPHPVSAARPRRRQRRQAGEVYLASGPRFRAKGVQTVPYGDRVIIASPGGGGRGNPRQARCRGCRQAMCNSALSRRRGRERDYGVVVEADGTVDHEATATLRAVSGRIAKGGCE